MDLAEELNEGEEIDWREFSVKKCYIYYNAIEKKLKTLSTYCCKDIGQIYCLNQNFLEIAKEKIGEDKLIKLFKKEN